MHRWEHVSHVPCRVLLVTDSYPPRPGGANRATQLLARELAQRGYAVAVATSWQAGLPTEEEDRGFRVHRLRDLSSRIPGVSSDPYQHVPPPAPDPEAIARLRGIVKRFRPDLVHVYGWLTYSCSLALAGSDIPLVVSARDYAYVCPKRTLLHRGAVCSGPRLGKCLRCSAAHYGVAKGIIATAGIFAGRPLIRRSATAFHSNSDYMRARMARDLWQVGSDRPLPVPDRVIPSFGSEADDEAADDAILARLPSEPYILFVGALRIVKGVPDLLEAYAMLDAPPPLVLIGTREVDTPEIASPNVTVLYDVPHSTVMAAWERALFGVFPSRLPEPLGMVVGEAMSRGKAVIGTEPGGHGEMVRNGVDGLIVPCGDVPALAAALDRLVRDVPAREAMGEAGRLRAAEFMVDAVMPRFERFYESVLEQRAGRAS
jgi:glycosyltransferase involved in cell wall biosynthesis